MAKVIVETITKNRRRKRNINIHFDKEDGLYLLPTVYIQKSDIVLKIVWIYIVWLRHSVNISIEMPKPKHNIC